MNYIIENIKSRRSVRSYSDQQVPKKLIEEVLEAARFAPSALNKQPWEFIVITDKKLIEELSRAVKKTVRKVYGFLPVLKLLSASLRDERTAAALKKTAASDRDTVFYEAPLLMFIVSGSKDRWVKTDCALAAQNMMLAAHSMGLGSCFVGRGLLLHANKDLLRKIGMRRGVRIHAALTFGYPREFPKTVPQRNKENLTCWKE